MPVIKDLFEEKTNVVPDLFSDSQEKNQSEQSFFEDSLETQKIQKENQLRQQFLQETQAKQQAQEAAANPVNWTVEQTQKNFKDNPAKNPQEEAERELLLETKKAQKEKIKEDIRQQAGIRAETPEEKKKREQPSIIQKAGQVIGKGLESTGLKESEAQRTAKFEMRLRIAEKLGLPPEQITEEIAKEYLRKQGLGAAASGKEILRDAGGVATAAGLAVGAGALAGMAGTAGGLVGAVRILAVIGASVLAKGAVDIGEKKLIEGVTKRKSGEGEQRFLSELIPGASDQVKGAMDIGEEIIKYYGAIKLANKIIPSIGKLTTKKATESIRLSKEELSDITRGVSIDPAKFAKVQELGLGKIRPTKNGDFIIETPKNIDKSWFAKLKKIYGETPITAAPEMGITPKKLPSPEDALLKKSVMHPDTIKSIKSMPEGGEVSPIPELKGTDRAVEYGRGLVGNKTQIMNLIKERTMLAEEANAILKKPNITPEEENKAAKTLMGQVQFLREAVESATNSGSNKLALSRTMQEMKDDVLRQVRGEQPPEGTIYPMGGSPIKPKVPGGTEEIPQPREEVPFAPKKLLTETFYQKVFNKMAPVERLEDQALKAGGEIARGESPKRLARSYLGIAGKVESILNDKTYSINPEGNFTVTGEGLRPILDDFEKGVKPVENNLKNLESDLHDYLVSRHRIEDLQRPVREGKENIASPAQIEEATNILAGLKAKYGDNFSVFESIAPRLYAFKNRVLHRLVESGRISEKTYGKMVSLNKAHVPLYRELPGLEEQAGGVPVKKAFNKIPMPVKRQKGSELPVHNVLGSVVHDVYRIEDIAERTEVANSVIALEKILPSEFKEVKPPMVPVAQVEHKAGYDPKLTEELLGVIKTLKAHYERKLRIGGKRLGYYQTPNKIVTKFGTPELVIAHELGHLIDYKYNLYGQIAKISEEQTGGNKAEARRYRVIIHKELNALADLRKVIGSHDSGEKMAALMDAYITKPQLLEDVAPNAKAMLNNIINSHEELAPLKNIHPSMEVSYETTMETIFAQSPFMPKGNVITGWENGKPIYREVSKNIYEAMSGLDKTSSGLLLKLMSAPASWLRTGATITPEFMTRNVMRDQLTVIMQTKLGFVPFKDPAGAIADILGKKEVYYDWLRSGGAQSGFVELSRKQVERRAKELMRPARYNLLRHLNPIVSLSDLSMLFEQASRLGVFKAAKRKGLSGLESGFQAREASVDFGVKGSMMTNPGRLIPFLTANLQGLDKTYRTMKGDPKGTLLKGFLYYTIPTLLLYLINRNNESYKQRPRWQKDLFYHIPLGNRGVLVPKGFTYGTIFSSIPERFFEYLDTKDPEAFKDLTKSVFDSISPVQGDPAGGIIPAAIKPLLENKLNWSFFRERPIVPQAKERLRPELQYAEYTTEIAKEAGKRLGYSPSKLENLIAGYFGGTGRYALQAGEKALELYRKSRGEEVPEKPKDMADYPLVRGWVSRPDYQGEATVNRFYDKADKIETDYNSYRYLLKSGDREGAKKIRKENPDLIYANVYGRAREALRGLSRQLEQVRKSKATSEIKNKNMKRLYERRLELLKRIERLGSSHKGS